MGLKKISELLYNQSLSEAIKEKSEKVILIVAILSFTVHLAIIALVNLNIIAIVEPSNLLTNPIAAIYTPFSFILVYEVYLLIYFLPKSTSNYISKQYEIIALIIIRRLFKDFSDVSLTVNWFNNSGDLQFTFDLVASVVLFYLIFLFHIQRIKIYRPAKKTANLSSSLVKFIDAKKWIATALVPILVITAIYSFVDWGIGVIKPIESNHVSFKNINNIFFEQFFSILIIAEVVILLFSFFYTDEFHKVIRNSGFIISTILIRISFSVSGLVNTVLIVSAVLFGLLMLFIHNKYEKMIAEKIEGKNEIGEKLSNENLWSSTST
ncbi:MAG: hypothetical protein RLZ10_2457 [Bacteroidota bacterium]|jgi:hypothetical protein